MFSKGDFFGITRTALTYSAIDEGTRIFGDTGIRALYDDANDLGKAVAGFGAGTPSTMTAYASDISKVFVEYAGELALNKVLKGSASDPVLSGVLSYSSAVNNRTLTVDLSDAAWKAANNGVLPEMAGPDDLAKHVLDDAGLSHSFFWPEVTSRWSWSSYFDRAVFALGDSGATVLTEGAPGRGTLFIGGSGADTVAANDNIRAVTLPKAA